MPPLCGDGLEPVPHHRVSEDHAVFALLIGDTRISVSKSHRKELMKRFSSFLGDSL